MLECRTVNTLAVSQPLETGSPKNGLAIYIYSKNDRIHLFTVSVMKPTWDLFNLY